MLYIKNGFRAFGAKNVIYNHFLKRSNQFINKSDILLYIYGRVTKGRTKLTNEYILRENIPGSAQLSQNTLGNIPEACYIVWSVVTVHPMSYI